VIPMGFAIAAALDIASIQLSASVDIRMQIGAATRRSLPDGTTETVIVNSKKPIRVKSLVTYDCTTQAISRRTRRWRYIGSELRRLRAEGVDVPTAPETNPLVEYRKASALVEKAKRRSRGFHAVRCSKFDMDGELVCVLANCAWAPATRKCEVDHDALEEHWFHNGPPALVENEFAGEAGDDEDEDPVTMEHTRNAENDEPNPNDIHDQESWNSMWRLTAQCARYDGNGFICGLNSPLCSYHAASSECRIAPGATPTTAKTVGGCVRAIVKSHGKGENIKVKLDDRQTRSFSDQVAVYNPTESLRNSLIPNIVIGFSFSSTSTTSWGTAITNKAKSVLTTSGMGATMKKIINEMIEFFADGFNAISNFIRVRSISLTDFSLLALTQGKGPTFALEANFMNKGYKTYSYTLDVQFLAGSLWRFIQSMASKLGSKVKIPTCFINSNCASGQVCDHTGGSWTCKTGSCWPQGTTGFWQFGVGNFMSSIGCVECDAGFSSTKTELARCKSPPGGGEGCCRSKTCVGINLSVSNPGSVKNGNTVSVRYSGVPSGLPVTIRLREEDIGPDPTKQTKSFTSPGPESFRVCVPKVDNDLIGDGKCDWYFEVEAPCGIKARSSKFCMSGGGC